MSTTPTLEELLPCYLDYLRALNRARRSINTHQAHMRRFIAWLGPQGIAYAEQVTRPLLLEYQRYLASSFDAYGCPKSVGLRNKMLTVIVGFFGWAVRSNNMPHNPTAGVEYARAPERLPRSILSLTDMRRLLRQPDVSTVLGFRDRTIFEVLYSTGLRRSELLNLDIEDANLESGFLLVRQGKGGKDRVVPIGRVASRYLETYLAGIRPELLKNGPDPKAGAIFLSTRGKRMSCNTLNDLVPRYARQAGLSISVSPHTFRHSCATHMVRNRAGLRHVQEMLGHKHLTTTQTYVRLTMADLKEAHSKFHPRERDH